jgi:hypothetical protein
MSQKHARQSRVQARSACRSRERQKRDVTLQMLHDVDRMETTLELEWWASWLFGEMWRRRARVPADCQESWELVLGAPIVEDMAAVGGRAGHRALTALARFDRGELGSRAFDLACGLREAAPDDEWELPDHIRRVGRATITQAEVTVPDPDGEALFLESRSGDEEPTTLAVFIDARLGGIAKRLGLVRSLDEIAEIERREQGGSPYRPDRYELSNRVVLDPVEGCRRLRDALLLTDLLLWPPVEDDYIAHRALALSRACSLA